MAVDVAGFRAYFAHETAVFGDILDPVIARFLQTAKNQIDEKKSVQAIFELCAHELAVDHHDISGVDDGAPVVQSEATGPMSKTGQEAKSFSDASQEWLRSKYGRRALRLLSGTLGPGR